MIKGIAGSGYFDELCIPIIENTAWEHELADSLGEAIAKVGPFSDYHTPTFFLNSAPFTDANFWFLESQERGDSSAQARHVRVGQDMGRSEETRGVLTLPV
jgi:hypothetical protein